MTKEGNKAFCDDFLQGQKDCREGVAHKDRSEAYNRGYASQYAAEQVMTERTTTKEDR